MHSYLAFRPGKKTILQCSEDMGGSIGGGGGGGTGGRDPHENSQNIEFLSNTGPDPLKNH